MTQDIAIPSKVVPLKPPSASELRTRLLAALPSILHYLLPIGVLRGGKFMVGNVQGDKGDSLVVGGSLRAGADLQRRHPPAGYEERGF